MKNTVIAKSGSDWTVSELLAYNIVVQPTPPDQFFGPNAHPPLDHLDRAILDGRPGDDSPNISEVAVEYLGYLDMATNATQKTFIDEFATQTLKLLGFQDRHSLIIQRNIIPLTICGQSRSAQTDVCLLHRPSMVLLVLAKDKTLNNQTPATAVEAQVIAEAIAAYQFNNDKRTQRTLPILDAMMIPCITMIGTRPTFYLVPVTKELSESVMTGSFPATQTHVLKCVTTPAHARAGEGMEDTEYRRLALKHFLAFKTLAKSHWIKFLDGL
jgi:hypothetical protein